MLTVLDVSIRMPHVFAVCSHEVCTHYPTWILEGQFLDLLYLELPTLYYKDTKMILILLIRRRRPGLWFLILHSPLR